MRHTTYFCIQPYDHNHANHMHSHLLTNYLDITADHLVQPTKHILTLTSQLVYFGTGPPKYMKSAPPTSRFIF